MSRVQGGEPVAVWDHIHPRNLIHAQNLAALKELEDKMREDQAAGYPVDDLLDRWLQIRRQLDGPIA